MPTLKYKDPVTGEYKSDIHVVGAVSSVNGKTGVVELTNSDITDAITDVQVNGTSVVTDGVATIPTARIDGGNAPLGLVGVRSGGYSDGIELSNGVLKLHAMSDDQAIGRSSALFGYRSSQTPLIVKSAMTSTTDPAWTATEQAAARTRLGIDGATQLLDMTTSETGSVDVTFEKCYRSVSVIINIPANTTWGSSDAVIYSDYSTRFIGAGSISALTSASSNTTITKVMAFVQDGHWRSTYMATTRTRWGALMEQALGLFAYSEKDYPYVNKFKCGVVPAGTRIIVYGY